MRKKTAPPVRAPVVLLPGRYGPPPEEGAPTAPLEPRVAHHRLAVQRALLLPPRRLVPRQLLRAVKF